MKRARRGIVAVLGFLLVVVAVGGIARSEESDRERADALFKDANYAEAATAYEALLAATEGGDTMHHASRRLVVCRMRLSLFDAALEAAEAYVERTKGTPVEARAERFAGNLWLRVPHWGTRAGGTFHRAQWKQGIQLQSYRHDKRIALAHLERARELYASWDDGARFPEIAESLGAKAAAGWREERIACLFDLAGACARFGIYERQWTFWWRYWGSRDDRTAETAGEEDFDEYHGDWQLRRKRPIGLRLGPDGDPIFPAAPKGWSADLEDDRKILWLFDEIRGLDPAKDKQATALTYYRQAMLARSRFGMDRLNEYAGLYWSADAFPLQEELKAFRPWELADGEALVLAGGRVQRVTLPPQWDVFGLLRTVTSHHASSDVEPQALYAVGVYYQSRQQYTQAKDAYVPLLEEQGDWTEAARKQVARIEARQVRINPTGVQFPGEPARLSLSHRNVSEVHFVARRIDLEGFFREVREQDFELEKGPQDVWALGNWSSFFMSYNERSFASRAALRHVGEVMARWKADVVDDGTHRYAETTVQTPVDAAGAYLVTAYLDETGEDDAKEKTNPLQAGNSRAAVVLTDVALVEKPAQAGKLYFVADARTGAPVADASMEVAEFWSIWRRKKGKSDHYREISTFRSDGDGLALDAHPKRDHRGNYQVLVTAGEGDAKRLAWSGMRWWHGYNPSRMEDGRFAYCITDRPVYRPSQVVRYKVWLRHMQKGIFQDEGANGWTVTVYDPRGNTVHSMSHQADEFGGIDGEWQLGEEPTLGVYRVHVGGATYAGGQTFRVEEYKKPEFEVTVEPGTTHAKLGQKLEAKVKATYYFGAPVTDAQVTYKVFREEYRHAWYAQGAWDWLYGHGYGYGWYAYDFFPWWPWVRSCWVAPPWWWGYLGRPAWGWGGRPVRELVQQGEGAIGADGTLSIEIDTAGAARDHADRDHRYVVQADVRDASRRVISGEGAVKVTRQAFYAVVNADRGWYRPGEEIVARVHCVSPANEPIETEGVVTVSEVVFGGPDNATYGKTEVDRFTAKTDERGVVELRLRHEKSGQLEIAFEAPDRWGGKVEGYGVVWVCGRDFDGKLHRFNDLEILTDKRTYQPGETAHLLVNTKRAGSYVLFGDEVDNGTLLSWKMLHVPQRSIVVDLPIEKGDAPNIFVEAATVSNTRLHQQVRRICVPPEDGVIDVRVTTDKPEYRPGETAQLEVEATTPDGEPADAQVTVSAFDRSVLYIQSEYTPQIAKFFHGRVRNHRATAETNLVEQFQAWGNVARPFEALHPYPPSWWGSWGPYAGDWRQFGDRDAAGLLGEAEGLASSGVTVNGATRAPASPAAAPPASGAGGERRSAGRSGKADQLGIGGGAGGKLAGDGGGEAAFADAEVRTKFADTALWATSLQTGDDGKVTTTVEMPENLTTWKVNTWAMTKGTRVGQASTSVVTTKDLLVRLQAPRFFMEYDEVVLSANVHNYLSAAKKARVSIDVPADLLELIGETPATVDVEVPADGEKRVDWRVKVVQEGEAKITVKALTDEESDAMQMAFPVLVHGMTKQVATTGSLRPDDDPKTLHVELQVPEKRRPELTRLEVRFSPSLVGAMLDALPYCLDYPYGCTEQTMSRFLPAVLTLKTLTNMGIRLEDVKEIRRGRMEEIRRMEAGENRSIWHQYWTSPVFDDDELHRIVAKGLQRIAKMQNGDGGWGWWTRDTSSPYLTSYVLYALSTARASDVAVDDGMLQRGANFLQGWVQGKLPNDEWRPSETLAFAAYVLSMSGQRAAVKPAEGDERPGDLVERLWLGRDRLNLYGKSLLSLALANLKEEQKAQTTLRNVLQYLEQNEETQVAWLRTPSAGWWYWWNNDIETNAWALRALVKLQPKSDVAPRLVKWLLNNRHNGYYWRSTRDTTHCVAAMSDFVLASGEGQPDYTLRFDLDDGAVVKEVKVSRENFFTYDNRFVVEGVSLAGGKHDLKITKTGKGALYLNTYLSYFTKEEHITAAGHELNVDRTYFRLRQIPYEVEVEGADGRPLKEQRLRYERKPLANGDTVDSGDLIQVELRVKSDNTYTYLAFEDPKPAGCEPVELRSGGKGQEGFYSYMELRDEKVAFFVNTIGQGEHLLRYRLRAEIPGVFHALPARVFAMYVPELRANSEEMLLRIVDD